MNKNNRSKIFKKLTKFECNRVTELKHSESFEMLQPLSFVVRDGWMFALLYECFSLSQNQK